MCTVTSFWASREVIQGGKGTEFVNLTKQFVNNRLVELSCKSFKIKFFEIYAILRDDPVLYQCYFIRY